MDSKEAQLVINEVLAVLEETSLDKYSVIGVKGKKEYSHGYTVCVKGFLGAVRKQRIYDIAKIYGLHTQEDHRRPYASINQILLSESRTYQSPISAYVLFPTNNSIIIKRVYHFLVGIKFGSKRSCKSYQRNH